MGGCSSKKHKQKPEEEEELEPEEFTEVLGVDTVSGLISLDNLDTSGNKIRNLVFADGGAKAFAYIGALKALELLGLMNKIKRFAGVGTGALIAAPLAIGLHSDSVQRYFKECLDSFELEVTNPDNSSYEIKSCFGMLSGTNFIERFNRLLNSRRFPIGLTFGQLYKKTGNELCIIVSNLTNSTLEYFHPKLTPDAPLNKTILMSLCVPGIFKPCKFRLVEEECHYLGGNLICSYPINAYDGWRLSMEDHFPRRLFSLTKYERSDTFYQRNEKSLGLVLLDRHQETNYPQLSHRVNRLHLCENIPDTPLGGRYRDILVGLQRNETHYLLVREAGFKLLYMVREFEEDILDELEVAKKIFEGGTITESESEAFFGKTITSVEEYYSTIKELNDNHALLYKGDFSAKVEGRMLNKLREYYNTGVPRITSLNTFFGALSNTVESSSFELTSGDFYRTVGILCKYVCSYNTDLEREDLCFLFRQGWNAVVAYFRYRKYDQDDAISDTSVDLQSPETSTSSVPTFF